MEKLVVIAQVLNFELARSKWNQIMHICEILVSKQTPIMHICEFSKIKIYLYYAYLNSHDQNRPPIMYLWASKIKMTSIMYICDPNIKIKPIMHIMHICEFLGSKQTCIVHIWTPKIKKTPQLCILELPKSKLI
jgi:hypothetical protein